MFNHEAALLSCLIRDNSCLDDVLFLDPTDFSNDFYADIFQTIKELVSKSINADVITIADNLKNKTKQNSYGDVYNIRSTSCAIDNVKLYANSIRQSGIKKNLQTACHEILRDISADDILEKSLALINAASDKRNVEIKNSDHLLDSFMELLNQRMQTKNGLIGIPSGFENIDQLTHGFQPGQLIVLAARPGMGKTTLAANFATHEVYENDGTVAFFTLEMSDIAIIERIISSQANIFADKLKTGTLTADDFDIITKQMKKMQGKRLFLANCEDVSEIASYCRQIRKKHGLSLVVIDYLGLLLHGKHEHAHLVLGEITRNLKKLALKLQTPILLLCQMNRAIENRQMKRPLLSDLRQSGNIEQDADIVMFISQPDEPHSSARGYALLNIAKHRNGEIADLVLKFDGQFNRFQEADISVQEYISRLENIKLTNSSNPFQYGKGA